MSKIIFSNIYYFSRLATSNTRQKQHYVFIENMVSG